MGSLFFHQTLASRESNRSFKKNAALESDEPTIVTDR